ncbi:hypothetical protein Droror1_Dr00025689, partial [Drosera rotundifolia]
MKDFVIKSQEALEKQFLWERRADYETMVKNHILIHNSPIEIQGDSLYMKEVFRRFRKELIKTN